MRALLVKFSSLGDVVHTFPALSDAAGAPGGGPLFDWAVEEQYAPLARLHPAVGRVVAVALRRWRRAGLAVARREFAVYRRELRAHRYDLVIDAQGLLKSALFGVLQARGPAHGFSFACAREPAAALFYGGGRHCVDMRLHAVERVRRLFAAALGRAEPEGLPDYGIAARFAGVPRRAAVMLFHGSAQPRKLWEERRWIALGQLLAEAGCRSELVWNSAQEKARARRIAAACGGEVLGPLGLPELAERVAGAHGAVGVDSGLTHLAAALEVPCVGLYVATDPRRSGNLGRLQGSYACAGEVSAATVAARLAQLAAARTGRPG